MPSTPHILSHLRVVPPDDRRARLASLRAQLAQLERHTGPISDETAACLPLGVPEIHAHLPTPGLAGGVLHEVAGATYADRPAAFGFVTALMAMAASSDGDARCVKRESEASDSLSPQSGERDGVRGSQGRQPLSGRSAPPLSPAPSPKLLVERPSLGAASHPDPLPMPEVGMERGSPGRAPTTCFGLNQARPAFLILTRRALAHFGRPYGRGLAQAGLDPGRLVLVETRSDKEALWALEEVLGADARPAVVAGAVEAPLGLTASRRLNLAAARCGAPLLVLGAPGQAGTSAAATRWRIAAAVAGRDRFRTPVGPRWRIVLERCRHGRPGEWLIEWDHAASRFRLAQGVADHAPAAGAGPLRHAG